MNGILFALALFAGAAAAGPSEPDSGPRRNARRIEAMIDRGELDAARRALGDAKVGELLEATLRGRLALAEDEPLRAIRSLRRAMELAPNQVPLELLLAHAQLAAGQPRDALATLERSKAKRLEPGVALLFAHAHHALGDAEAAYEALRKAAKASPDDRMLPRQLVLLCASEGLFETAKVWAARHDPAALGSETATVALQHARGVSGGLEFARWLAAGFPDDATVQAELGWVESAAGRYREAGRALSRAADQGADTAFAAAEHYRAARRYRDALVANAKVASDARRSGQRFDILFEGGKMARAAAAGKRLEGAGALVPRRRYNLAYTHYALREFAEATRHARALKGTSEASRAAALLRAMGR